MILRCERCGYEWEVSPDPEMELPDQCASIRCKSNYWDMPRKINRAESSWENRRIGPISGGGQPG